MEVGKALECLFSSTVNFKQWKKVLQLYYSNIVADNVVAERQTQISLTEVKREFCFR